MCEGVNRVAWEAQDKECQSISKDREKKVRREWWLIRQLDYWKQISHSSPKEWLYIKNKLKIELVRFLRINK